MKKTKRLLSLALAICLVLTMIPAVLAAMPFADVPADAWYAEDVQNAYEMALINGKTKTSFAPDDNLTYAEAVKLAACMHQRYTTGVVTLQNGTPWYQSYVDYCKINGIITKDYAWEQTATRAGYIEIFANALPADALAEINAVEDGSIVDVPMVHPQAEAIYKLYRAGVLQGNDALRSCSPAASIMRSEVAAILTRMMDSTERVSFTLGEVDEDEDVDEKDEKDDKDEEEEIVQKPEKPEKPETQYPGSAGTDQGTLDEINNSGLGENDLPFA